MRRSGTVFFKIDGQVYETIASINYNIGKPKREALVGHDTVHGYKELPQVPFCELEIRDSSTLDLDVLLTAKDATITIELANEKTIVFRNAWYAGEGTIGSEEANIQCRFEALAAEEVR
jgi:hypothetical protein